MLQRRYEAARVHRHLGLWAIHLPRHVMDIIAILFYQELLDSTMRGIPLTLLFFWRRAGLEWSRLPRSLERVAVKSGWRGSPPALSPIRQAHPGKRVKGVMTYAAIAQADLLCTVSSIPGERGLQKPSQAPVPLEIAVVNPPQLWQHDFRIQRTNVVGGLRKNVVGSDDLGIRRSLPVPTYPLSILTSTEAMGHSPSPRSLGLDVTHTVAQLDRSAFGFLRLQRRWIVLYRATAPGVPDCSASALPHRSTLWEDLFWAVLASVLLSSPDASSNAHFTLDIDRRWSPLIVRRHPPMDYTCVQSVKFNVDRTRCCGAKPADTNP